MTSPDLIDRAKLLAFMDRVLADLTDSGAVTTSYRRGYFFALREVKSAPRIAAKDAAPDLFAALANLSALNDDHAPFGGEIYQDRVTRAWDAARAALAKARGQS